MQHERLEYQWQYDTSFRPEWVHELFTTFVAWHTVGPKALTGEIGVYTKDGIKFAMPGDWIVAEIDGTYNIIKEEDYVR
jgi:hypothetical protein